MNESSNYIGSDEFSNEEFERINKLQDAQTKLFEEAARASQEARKFLATSLGKALRKTIGINKAAESVNCTKLKGDELDAAQAEYAAWEKVEQVFTTIILEGEVALQALQQRGTTHEQEH